MDELVAVLGGPAMGAALVGLVWALSRAIDKRASASAAQDTASAAAVNELIVQIGAVRRDLERETVARVRLQEHVDRLESALAEAQSRASHLEGQVHILTLEKQQAEGWARSLAAELAELRLQIQGSHTVPSSVPKR